MYLRYIGLSAIFLLLASCAQTQPKPDSGLSPAVNGAQQPKIVRQIYQPSSTHPASLDITYSSRYPPVFPQNAIRDRHYGTVVLMIYVDAKGEVGDVRVDQSSGYSDLDASATVTARQWMFKPAVKNGVPQASWVRTPVNFNLNDEPPSTSALQANATVKKSYQAEQHGDYAAAYALLKPLAEQGNVTAQYSLGLFYRNGTGVARDDVQAVMWFRKAAEQGNADAQNNLGMMYLDGRGVAKDFPQATLWFERSALIGSAFGESNFGLAYARGDVDGKPNYVVGYALLLASSSRIQLYPSYAKGVANNLSALQGTMDQRQLELGKKLAEQIEKNGLVVAMSNHWYGADYAVSDPCKSGSNKAVCDDERYQAALKNLGR
jgi:TonB family protein